MCIFFMLHLINALHCSYCDFFFLNSKSNSAEFSGGMMQIIFEGRNKTYFILLKDQVHVQASNVHDKNKGTCYI